MKNLIEKFQTIESRIAEREGDFTLFGLFLREDALNVWDVVVAAPWIYGNKRRAVDVISEGISSVLDAGEIVSLARIVIIDEDNPGLEDLFRELDVNHGQSELRNTVLFGLNIERAIIITCQRGESIKQNSGAAG